MRLSVLHTTAYRYDPAVRSLVQSLKLWPSRFDGQVTLDWTVTVEGEGPAPLMRQETAGMGQEMAGSRREVAPQMGAGFRDGAGDWTQTAALRGPLERVTVTVKGTVETTDLSGVLRHHRESVPPRVYLRSTRATEPDVALTDLAREVIGRTEGQGPLARAHRLCGAVAEAIRHAPGETDATTTAAEALARGEGVCQDHAHALIACAHLAGIPARYVVGYLDTATAMGEAGHAWAELCIDGLGWVGFDPANECCPDDRYIRLCSGFDAADAAPIRGTASGGGEEHLDVSVAVQQQPQ